MDLSHQVDPVTGCWTTGRALTTWGYVKLNVGGKMVFQHRLFYELHVGPIPDGLQLDHLCRNRPCCNPSHLEPVTQAENQRRSPITLASVHAAKTHCPHGHVYDEANTTISNGRRYCRACKRAAYALSKGRH